METFFSGTVTVLVTVTVTVEHHFFFLYIYNFWKIGGFGFNGFLACTGFVVSEGKIRVFLIFID